MHEYDYIILHYDELEVIHLHDDVLHDVIVFHNLVCYIFMYDEVEIADDGTDEVVLIIIVALIDDDELI